MLKYIKSKLYSFLLYSGTFFYKDRYSKVIYYHDIHSNADDKCSEMSTPLQLFLKHIEIIKSNGFEVVNQITKPKNQIKITFDDGFKGFYNHRNAMQLINVFPTIYIITSKIGKPNYLTWTELLELVNSGFNVQSHTHNHQDLNILNKEKLMSELEISKNILETKLPIEINEICFPKGLFNDLVLESCHNAGYTKWYCSIPGSNEDISSFSQLKYRNLVQFSSQTDFKNILLGGLKIFKNRYSKQHYGKKIHLS